MENARRGLGEITTGTFSSSGREARTAAAPRATACAANPAPSAFTPGSAAKRAPGAARRESTASARTSTSAAPGGTTASTPVNNSLNSTLPPTLRVVLFLPEYDGYPGGARVTFTLAPRLTIAPARGDCATARPLPRSSGSREACASLRSEEHTSELQSQFHLVCRLLLEKKKKTSNSSPFLKKKKKKKKTKL